VSSNVETAPALPPQSGPPAPPSGPKRRIDLGVRTLRKDRWWVAPLVSGLGLLAFLAYATWRAFENKYYFRDPYLSPFYSPCLAKSCTDTAAPAIPIFSFAWISPALYILLFPAGFRATCYYYRKSYYRSFWMSPPGCAVAEPHKKYTGETRFPLIFNNAHRWFWYVAVVFAGILTWEAFSSFYEKGVGFHFGLGTVILLINAALIWGYTLGCHSCRHITAGKINSFSKHPMRYKFWTFVSKLNARHGSWALYSMWWIMFTDLYIRLVAAGTLSGGWV
jgi:hypothetical protein